MIVNVGTKKGVKTKQVDQESLWKKGFEEMKRKHPKRFS